MKRVVSLVAALALAVGAFAPAAFASDAGYGQTDLIPLEDLDQETFDTYLAKFYSQDYPTYGVLDLIRDTFQGGLANASGLNDSPWSWALNLVDNVSDIGTEVGLWFTGVKIDPNTGKAIYPDDYLTDYGKDQLDTQLKDFISGSQWENNGNVWVSTPFSLNNGYSVAPYTFASPVIWYDWPVWCCRLSNGTLVFATWQVKDNTQISLGAPRNTQQGFSSYGNINSSYNFSGTNYRVGSYSNGSSYYSNNVPVSNYSSSLVAYSDFYSNFVEPSAGTVWNGSGYYSEHQDGFSINLPSLPSTNWGNLSKYYYTTYGDEIYEGDVDRYYYNIANNYAPYEVSYELPYWLINGSTDILDFDYSLELPTAELSTLPSDFEGGSNFWDNSFSMLAGFGSFIVLGLSFALVGLFFKD